MAMKLAGWVALTLGSSFVLSAGVAHAEEVEVLTSGMLFAPNRVTIHVGDSVRWRIALRHNVVETTDANCIAKEGGFMSGDSELDLSVREYTLVFDEVGTYYYMCTPHCEDGMIGQVEVLLPGQDGPGAGSSGDEGGCLNAAHAGPPAILGSLICWRGRRRRRRRRRAC